MTKIMLVEDDKSLREIYGVRLLAEGYDIVSAGDGEEALAMAIKERPQLIISDVMMPKISGFDLLDILRSTTETRNIRVIMMTALSSEEQRLRGEQLGADRYLVKSQVGIEDVVNIVHNLLEDTSASQPTPPQAALNEPHSPEPTAPTPSTSPSPSAQVVTPPVVPSQPGSNPLPIPVTPVSTPSTAPQTRNRIIAPLNDPLVSTANIQELYDKEVAKENQSIQAATPIDKSSSTIPIISAEPIPTVPTPIAFEPPTTTQGPDNTTVATAISDNKLPTPTNLSSDPLKASMTDSTPSNIDVNSSIPSIPVAQSPSVQPATPLTSPVPPISTNPTNATQPTSTTPSTSSGITPANQPTQNV